MLITAKADYGIRAAVELASAGRSMTADEISDNQEIPLTFLVKILNELRNAGIVASQRGPQGGYSLRRDASETTLAEVLRAIDGSFADVHGTTPEEISPPGGAASLRLVWIALLESIDSVLESVTLADVADAALPPSIVALADRAVASQL